MQRDFRAKPPKAQSKSSHTVLNPNDLPFFAGFAPLRETPLILLYCFPVMAGERQGKNRREVKTFYGYGYDARFVDRLR